jgi:perosamine synthetase
LAIPRTIVYHPVWLDVRNYFASFRDPDRISSAEKSEKVEEFERAFARYIGVSSAHAFPYARSALYFALKAQNFEPGSEIIMPPITIKPMMDVVISLGLKPVFADIELDTLCFDPHELKKAISPNTRAILITYLFGVAPNIEPLMALCREHDLFVVEDFSHALNASWNDKKLGTFGNVGIYSCSKTKTLDAYGGGLAVTNDPVLAERLEEAQRSLKPTPPARLRTKIMDALITNVATRRPVFTAAVAPMLAVVGKFSPEKAEALTGARQNLKPDTVLPEEYFEQFTSAQAEVGLAMLEKVGSGDDKRISNVAELRRPLMALGEPCVRTVKHGRSVYWQFVVFAPNPERFRKALASRGIDTGTTNLSLVCGLGIYPEYEKKCPNAERVKNNAMYIPVYPRLGATALEHVIDAIPYALEQSG